MTQKAESPTEGGASNNDRAIGRVQTNCTTQLSFCQGNIPPELRERAQWVTWRLETKRGRKKPTKVPYDPKTGSMASTTDPSTWASFEDAVAACLDGIGYVLTADDGLTGIDFDHCLDDGQLKEWAEDMVGRLSSYTEVSPSGKGLHVFVKGSLPPEGRRRGDIEMYEDERYLTITGKLLRDDLDTIEERQESLSNLHARVFPKKVVKTAVDGGNGTGTRSDAEVLRLAQKASNGDKFVRLFEGNWNEFPSQSEADLALCSLLAFYSGGDVQQIDRLFRRSKMYRPKWDDSRGDSSYGEITLAKAVSNMSSFYDAPRRKFTLTDGSTTHEVTTGEARTLTEKPTPAEWPIYTLADAYAPRPPLVYVVDGLFSLPSLSIVFGAPGCLKSMLVADAALCVAGGLPWLPSLPRLPGMPAADIVPRKTVCVPTLWLDFDNGARRTHERIDALASARNLDATSTPFYYASMPSPWLNGNDTASVEGVIDIALSLSVGFIVVDNLGTVSGDADENSTQMVHVMSNFRQLAENTNAAVVLIHHQRKSTGFTARGSETLRGSSSINAALDLALLVSRERGESSVTVESTKTRGPEVAQFGAMFTYEHREGTTELEHARFFGVAVEDDRKPARAERAILEAMDDAETPPNKSALVRLAKDIYDDIGDNYFRRTINTMVDDGKLVENSGPNYSKLYSLPV